jgi:hypothetical protein
MIGPPEMARGRTTGLQNRGCDRMKCTACDFAVISFPDTVWRDEVDYFFIRNKFPIDRSRLDVRKLQEGLKPMPGSTSYCCQCAWVSVQKPMPVSQCKEPAPSWRCGGH